MDQAQEYINQTYNLKTRKGQHVIMNGTPGTVAGWRNHYVLIKFPNRPNLAICHPTWGMEYID